MLNRFVFSQTLHANVHRESLKAVWRGYSAFPEVAVLESSPEPSSVLDRTSSHPRLPNGCLAPDRFPAQRSAYRYVISGYIQVPFYPNFLRQ